MRCLVSMASFYLSARDPGAARLESDAGEMRVSSGDIGRIGQDEIKALARQRLEPASMPEFDLQPEFDCITLGNDQRCGARLDRDHARSWPLSLDRERDRPRPGAEVDDRGERALQPQIDQQLGLRPRDENSGVDRELE